MKKQLNKMRTLLILSFLIASSMIQVTIQESTEPSFVTTLTDDTFNNFINENEYVLVEFYAPWCGHCKKLTPEYEAAAAELQYTPYKLAKVDATVEKKSAQEAGVSGYPTLKFYIKGEEKEYTGERTKDGIVDWVKNRVEQYEEQKANRIEGEPELDGDVVVLTDDTFDSFVKKHDFVFVKFYAPWCGHCKQMAPALSNAASEVAKTHPHIKIAKLDATKETVVGKKVGIKGYPTLKFYYRGIAVDYTGGREAKDIVKFVVEKTKNPITTLFSINDVEEFKKKKDVTVVLFGGNEMELFKAFAVSYEHALFGYVPESQADLNLELNENEELENEIDFTQIFTHYKVKSGAVVLFKSFDEGRNDLPGVYSIPTMRNFVENRSIPTLITFSDSYKRYIYNGSLQAIVLFYSFESSNADTYDDVMFDLSRRVKGKFLVIRSDIVGEEQEKFAEDLGISSEMLPAVVFLDYRDVSNKDKANHKFIMPKGRINSNTIRQFVSLAQAGNAPVLIKSEEEPEFQNDPVYTLVGKTFEKIVYDTYKDVLVEFYAPWCGHCQKLAPMYEELARTLSENSNLLIAKIDATKNEVKGQEISGYPTIKFYPAQKKESPITFSRSEDKDNIEEFIKFIKQHASFPITTDIENLENEEENEEAEEKYDL